MIDLVKFLINTKNKYVQNIHTSEIYKIVNYRFTARTSNNIWLININNPGHKFISIEELYNNFKEVNKPVYKDILCLSDYSKVVMIYDIDVWSTFNNNVKSIGIRVLNPITYKYETKYIKQLNTIDTSMSNYQKLLYHAKEKIDDISTYKFEINVPTSFNVWTNLPNSKIHYLDQYIDGKNYYFPIRSENLTSILTSKYIEYDYDRSLIKLYNVIPKLIRTPYYQHVELETYVI